MLVHTVRHVVPNWRANPLIDEIIARFRDKV